MKRTFLAILLLLVFMPVLLVSIPRPAHAIVVFDPSNFVKNTITAAMSGIIQSATNSLSVKEYVLDPIAWALSQRMIQSVTGSVVNFVNGQGNGAGAPQFVQNLPAYLQNVGDNQAFAFFSQFASNSNSPFAGAIVSSLRTNYLRQTSVAGFFAANQCTLAQYSPNPNAFLAGDWSQGGAGAWFALTTQDQNNPYTLYQNANREAGSLVTNAQAAQQAQLNWGQGFQSWCGSGTPAASSGVAPVQCLNSDGTHGTIQTPGAVIVANLNHSIAAGLDKLVAADEISEVVGQLAANLVSNALGGASGGLFGLSQGGSSSYVSQYQGAATAGTNGQAPGAGAAAVAQTALNSVAAYDAVWNAIIGAADTASTSMNNVIQTCPAEASAAQAAITGQVAPMIQQAQSAIASAQATQTLALKVQAEASSNDTATLNALLADAQTLATMPPSAADVATAQSNQQAQIDQMNSVTQNAASLQSACASAASSVYSY